MYAQDSFFDLSLWGRIGLVCLSAVLFLIFLWLAFQVRRFRSVWIRVAAALALFWIFVWVSPQVYYQYYHLLFEFLPNQWVIWPPPSPVEAFSLLIFQGPQNLSAHSQGVLGWSMVLVSFWGRR